MFGGSAGLKEKLAKKQCFWVQIAEIFWIGGAFLAPLLSTVQNGEFTPLTDVFRFFLTLHLIYLINHKECQHSATWCMRHPGEISIQG